MPDPNRSPHLAVFCFGATCTVEHTCSCFTSGPAACTERRTLQSCPRKDGEQAGDQRLVLGVLRAASEH